MSEHLRFSELFVKPAQDDNNNNVPSLKSLCLNAVVNAPNLMQQDPYLSACTGSLKQELITLHKAKNPKFNEIYEQAEQLLRTLENFHDINNEQQVLRPFEEFAAEYQGLHWREIEFWALQTGLSCAVMLSTLRAYRYNEQPDPNEPPFIFTPTVQVFDRLLRQKFKTAGFLNAILLSVLHKKNTDLLLPYAQAMQLSFKKHPELHNEAVR